MDVLRRPVVCLESPSAWTFQGKHQPRIELVGADPKALYTLLMVDPDAPRPEDRKWSEYLHLMITNISEGKISTGNIVVDYV